MSFDQPQRGELHDLLLAMEEGSLSPEGVARIDELVQGDAELLRCYLEHVRLVADLHFGLGDDRVKTALSRVFTLDGQQQRPTARNRQPAIRPERDFVPLPTIVIPNASGLSPTISSFNGLLLSYLIAGIVVGIGLFAGWVCRMPDYKELAGNSSRPSEKTEREAQPVEDMVFVGQITNMVDCRWADPRTEAFPRARVPLGRKYALASGLMEIAYDTGAKVILEGPCTYKVDVKSGGFLSVGRLTARVETKGEGERGKAEQKQTGAPPSTFPLPPSPLFSVRTPTAVVTDLGTEFGVEVDRSGASRTHVFRGKVEVRAAGNGNSGAVLLAENQSARIEVSKNLMASVVREAGRGQGFVREMPKSAPIQFFNTGKGLKAGDADPHWQVVARSDDPDFKPQPAVVVVPIPANGADNPSRSQWIALSRDYYLPDDVVYVFRTTFDMTGILPSRAMMRGRFIADDHVVAVRLNGHRINVPVQHEGEPYVYWSTFSTHTGFVKGTNVLEIEVLNASPYISPSERHATKSRSPTYCIVELDGEGVCDPAFVSAPKGKPGADSQLTDQKSARGKQALPQDSR
jgi:hypothetical protein